MSRLSARLDRIPFGRFHVRLLTIGGLGYLFDAMDVAIIAFVLPVLKVQWHLAPVQIGVLAAAAAMGGIFGAAGAGWLGDIVGRRAVMMWALTLFCAATLASAFASDWRAFLVWRVIAGIGTSAESAIVAPFLAEFAAPSFRGRYVGALASFFSFGFVAAALLSYFIVPLRPDAWRYLLGITSVPVVMLLWWRRSLPESPRWLESKGRFREADELVARIERDAGTRNEVVTEPSRQRTQFDTPQGPFTRVPIAVLFSRALVGLLLMTCLMWFAIGFAYYAFFTWIPSLLVDRGMGVAAGYGYALIMYSAQVPGYLTAAALNDIIGRRGVIVAYMLLGSCAALLLAASESNFAALVWGSCLSFFMNGTYAGVYAYTPELFQTEIRATAHGFASAISRIGAVVAPIAIGYVAPRYGFPGVFGLSAGVLLIGALVVMVFGIRTTGRTLEQIAPLPLKS